MLSICVRLVLFHTLCSPEKALDVQIATIISNIAGIIFAYFTNRSFVFHSKNKNRLKEASSFVLGRISTLLMDMGIMFVFVTCLHFNDKIMKLVVQVVVTSAIYTLPLFPTHSTTKLSLYRIIVATFYLQIVFPNK